jgi:soluble lytic murein transglycosylase-like protein
MERIIILILIAAALFAAPVCAAESDPWQSPVFEASQRFNIPQNWIRAVIATESGGDPKAVSPKGAMGLMQLMPDTWGDMNLTYVFGSDPFDPRTNILAGTAFLKVLYDRFGYPALFAAYNAGATRYEDFLRAGKPLPDETKTYAANIEKALFETQILASKDTHPPLQIASGTRLFFRLSTAENGAHGGETSVFANGLFVRISTRTAEGK